MWDFDTAQPFPTVNGVKAHGGSIDVGGPAIADGMLLTTSGYGQWGGVAATSSWPSRWTANKGDTTEKEETRWLNRCSRWIHR